MADSRRGGKRWRPIQAIVVATAGGGVILSAVYGYERAILKAREHGISSRGAAPASFLQVEAPGVTRPPTVTAATTRLGDDEQIIGVEVAGRSRAYRLGALRGRTNHVVNDLIDGTPVSVAYCDISRCVRVYTDPEIDVPLDVRVGGLYVVDGGEMVLKVDGRYYFQRSGHAVELGTGPGSIPYRRIEPILTTWGEWVRRHPTTDVYEGRATATTP